MGPGRIWQKPGRRNVKGKSWGRQPLGRSSRKLPAGCNLGKKLQGVLTGYFISLGKNNACVTGLT